VSGDTELKLLKLEARVATLATGEGERRRSRSSNRSSSGIRSTAMRCFWPGTTTPGAVSRRRPISVTTPLPSSRPSRADAFLKHAQLKVQQQKYTQAVELLRRAQKAKPRDNVARYLERVEQVAATGPFLRRMAESVRRTRSRILSAHSKTRTAVVRWAWLAAPGVGLAGRPSSSTASAQDTGTLTGLIIEGWDGRPHWPGSHRDGARDDPRRDQRRAGTLPAVRTLPPGDQVVRFSALGLCRGGGERCAGVPRTDPRPPTAPLRPEFYEMEEYEVTAEVFQEQALTILQERQDSSSILEAIGSEQFRGSVCPTRRTS
jgi:hypothetical protein